jgi:ABC-type branched-subunit amino acid transport system ATPase component
MSSEVQPTCYVIAGPNGAGKTTFSTMSPRSAIIWFRKFRTTDFCREKAGKEKGWIMTAKGRGLAC